MGKKITPKDNRKKGRFLFSVIIICLVYIGLSGRLFYVMVVKGKEYKALALKQQVNKIPIPSQRGKILDRNGHELALNTDVYKIDADIDMMLTQISNNKKLSLQEVEQAIATILNIDMNAVTKIFQTKDSEGNPSQYVNMKRQADKSTADALQKLKINGIGIKGIIITQDVKRYYPDDNLFSQVIGHINSDSKGITGVELSYDGALTGIPGQKVEESDRHQNDLPYEDQVVVAPVNGKDITLTLDERIQQMAASTAEQALHDNNAKAVSITVMDPNTGEILAMVNKPDYDPNNPGKGASTSAQAQEMWKNSTVENVFEPGSIFKVITAAAGLENNLINDSAQFDCNGSIKVANTTLYCDNREAHGKENLTDILRNSCNVGFIELGQRLEKDRLFKFTDNMGFGKKTGIDLPGESSGIMKDSKKMGPVDFATVSYGQGLALTQVQYMAAFNAVANGGTWIKPHVMKTMSTVDTNNKPVITSFDSLDKRTVMSSDNAAKLRKCLESVVKDGTATKTFMADLPIAGKTGTAKEVDTKKGGYIEGKYISSFAAMAPADNPVITMVVTVYEPNSTSFFAGDTAVPAAKDLFTKIFSYIPMK